MKPPTGLVDGRGYPPVGDGVSGDASVGDGVGAIWVGFAVVGETPGTDVGVIVGVAASELACGVVPRSGGVTAGGCVGALAEVGAAVLKLEESDPTDELVGAADALAGVDWPTGGGAATLTFRVGIGAADVVAAVGVAAS